MVAGIVLQSIYHQLLNSEKSNTRILDSGVIAEQHGKYRELI